jgi:hypothetical protein
MAGKALAVRDLAVVLVTLIAVIDLLYAMRLRELAWIYHGFEATLQAGHLQLRERLGTESPAHKQHYQNDDRRFHSIPYCSCFVMCIRGASDLSLDETETDVMGWKNATLFHPERNEGSACSFRNRSFPALSMTLDTGYETSLHDRQT